MASQKGLTGGWSKYGGARQHVIKTTITKTWICQSCGKETPKELSPFMVELVPGEFFRVCAVCVNNGTKIVTIRRMTLTLEGYD